MNTDLSHVDLQLNATTLTEEEEFLVERLVDGELSESERASLLFRLDETVDGWRFCALSFLEAQAFRAAMRDSTGAESPLPLAEALKTNPVPRRAAPRAKAIAKKTAVGVGKTLNTLATTVVGFLIGCVAVAPLKIGCNASNHDPRVDSPGAIAQTESVNDAENGDEINFLSDYATDVVADADAFNEIALNSENGMTEVAPEFASNAADDAIVARNARIAPPPQLKPFGSNDGNVNYGVAPNETLALNDGIDAQRHAPMGGGMSASSLSFRSENMATSNPEGRDATSTGNGAAYALSARRATNPLTAKKAPTTAETTLADASNDSKPSPDQTMSQLVASSAVKTARLSSPSRGLSNVIVPYAEADSYDSSASKAFIAENSKLPPEVADCLRDGGGRLESNRTQYRFPLKDGRTLILPVDNYTVSYDEDQPIW